MSEAACPPACLDGRKTPPLLGVIIDCSLSLSLSLSLPLIIIMHILPGGEDEGNYSTNKFHKISNAYMLVYIRDSSWQSLMGVTGQEQISEGLRARFEVRAGRGGGLLMAALGSLSTHRCDDSGDDDDDDDDDNTTRC